MAENEVAVDLNLAFKQANKTLDDILDKVQEFGDKAGKGIGKAEIAWGSFVGVLAAKGAEKALQLAWQGAKKLFDLFIVQGVGAATAAEDAITDLNVALSMAGHFSRETSLDIQDLAEQIQATTRYEDDAVLSTAAMIETLGQLDKDGLKRATKAAVDMASALKIDLTTAAQLVGKAAQGEIGTLSRYGIVVQEGADKAETFARVLNLVESRFGGDAAAKVNNYRGALDQAVNTFDDLQETTGGFITRNPFVITAINMASKAFQDAKKWIQANEQSITDFVNNGIVIAVKALGYMVIGLDGVIRGLKGLWQIGGLVFDSLVNMVMEWANRFVTAADFALGWIPGLGDQLGEAQDAVQNFTEATRQQMQDDAAAIRDTFTEEGAIGEAGEAIVRFGDALQIEADKHAGLMDTMATNTQNSVQRQKTWIEKLTDFYTENNGERVQNLKQTLGTIAGLTKENNSVLFAIGKAAAIAQATIDGIAAVQVALKSAPPPFNFALAALVGVASAVNIAKIAATPPPKAAEGMIVPGTARGGDRVMVGVNSEEMILNRRQIGNLFNAIRSNNLGNGGGPTFVFPGLVVDSGARLDELLQALDDRKRFWNATGMA